MHLFFAFSMLGSIFAPPRYKVGFQLITLGLILSMPRLQQQQ